MMFQDADVWQCVRDVPGWLTEPEVYSLAGLARSATSYAELGVFAGRSLLTAALSISENGTVYGVDKSLSGRVTDAQADGQRELYRHDVDRDHTLTQTVEAIHRLRPDVSVHLLEMDTKDAAHVLPDVDLLFIDALHDYGNVIQDISLYTPKAGILAGHDYATGFPGVMQAVDELLPDRHIVEGTSVWVYKKIVASEAPLFKESDYLAKNADVAEAVKQGIFESGEDHFYRYGIYESRTGVPAEMARVERTPHIGGVPVPPARLRVRVHGAADVESFYSIGRGVSDVLSSTLDTLGVNPEAPMQVLDFGCGCGRIARWLGPALVNSKLQGTDIDSETIAWCDQNIGELGTFTTNGYWPPLDVEDARFDIVYATSVFTHLPYEMQFAWLDELIRVTQPGGYLLLTVLGAEVFRFAFPSEHDQFLIDGFRYIEGHGAEGLPDFYQTAYHTEQYIKDYWSKHLTVLQIAPRAIGNYQDLVICQKPRPLDLAQPSLL